MNPRPPYRWKSMWIGLFVLGFLLWAWQDGLHQEIRLTYAGPGTTWQASRLDGSTVLVAGGPMLIESSPGSGWVPGWSFHRAQRRWNLTSATSYWDASSQADVRYLVIPDILVIIPCFAVWISWIGWRMWRSQHLETKYLQRQ